MGGGVAAVGRAQPITQNPTETPISRIALVGDEQPDGTREVTEVYGQIPAEMLPGQVISVAPSAQGEEQSRMEKFITSNLRDELSGWEVLELERQDSMLLGAHELTGTPDGVVRNRQTNAIYALQWKTCAGSRPLEVLFDEVRVSLHECAYEAMIKQRYTGEHFGGTLLGVWRKLTAKQRAQGESAFVLHQVSRSQSEVDTALSELRTQADDMERASQVQSAFSLVSRRRECVSFNWRCQYFGVCHGSDTLMDDRFEDVPGRYAALEAAE